MTDRGVIFEKVKVASVPKNRFDLSFENKLTCNMGDLIPICLQECLPNDYFVNFGSDVIARMTPMLAPVYHNIDMYVHYFFVPMRLVWDDATKFLSPGDGLVTMAQSGEYIPPVKPFVSIKTLADLQKNYDMSIMKSGSLWDYYGLPSIGDTPSASDEYPSISNESILNMQDDDPSLKIDILPFRAYQLIWNEYYRDQNLTPAKEFSKDSGEMVSTGTGNISDFGQLFSLNKRCWEKEYFTSALPTPQRGQDVLLPLGTSADVLFNVDGLPQVHTAGTPPITETAPGEIGFLDATSQTHVTETKRLRYSADGSALSLNSPALTARADLSEATAINVESLREAMMLQSFLEKTARSGARYDEIIKIMFDIYPEDARLQRPEYLGGGKQPIMISEVQQNSATVQGSTPQGNLAGKGTSANSTNSFSYLCKEHGYIIGILSVRPKTAYSQGIPRKFTRFDMYDYAWPDFANLGEQPVLNKELYFNGDDYNEEVFGYQSRYADYKYNADEFHADFRTNLNYWHLGRQFDARPGLNTQFMTVSDVNRIFAIVDDNLHHLYLDIFNNIIVDRTLPKFAIPKF